MNTFRFKFISTHKLTQLLVDSNLDMEYLEGRNEENKSEENNNESDLDDESNASDDNERDSDLQSSNRNEEGKGSLF